MDKDFVNAYYQNNHYFKSGIFAVLALISLFVFLPIGEIRFVFLVFLLFIPVLVFEFVNYHLIMKEFRKNIIVTNKMKLGRMSIIEMKHERVGIKFEGIIDGKVEVLSFYTLERRHEAIMNNLARYPYIEFDYYNRSKVVKEFRSLGE